MMNNSRSASKSREKKIVMTLDAAYKAKVETYQNFQMSLFSGIYENAAEMILDILNDTQVYKNVISNGEQICNIITFMGERGKGKTSAMLSFCNFLNEIHRIDIVNEKDFCSNFIKNISDRDGCFVVLDCMDVTLLAKDETIIDLILGKMLDKIKGENIDFEKNIKDEISKIYESLHNKDFEDTAAIVALKDRSQNWKLREAFQRLFLKFNEYFADKKGCRQCYTILMIDDIDMNVANCYEMLEMIRQFVMLPEVIIMMSINYRQLETVCQNHYYKELFSANFGAGEMVEAAYQRALDLTKVYLEKIIPAGRRIYMPDLYRADGTFEKEVKIICLKKGRNKTKEKFKEMEIKQVILFNLHRYLRILFNGMDGEVHFLQPDTIRQLNDMIVQFNNLKTIEDTGKAAIDAYEYNSSWFYNDLVNRYMVRNLDEESLTRIQEFLNTNINDKLQFLFRVLRKLKLGEEAADELLKYNPAEVGYGEVILLLRLAEREDALKWKEIQSIRAVLSSIMTHIVFQINEWKQELYSAKPDRAEADKLKDILAEWEDKFRSFTRSGIWSRVQEKSVEVLEHKIDSALDFDRTKEADDEKSLQQIVYACEIVSLFIGSKEPGIKKREDVPDKDGRNDMFQMHEAESFVFNSDYCRYSFGSFIYAVWDYDDWLEKIDKCIKKLLGEEINTDGLFVLKKEMKQWEQKYKTTAVVPFYSVEIMDKISNELYQNLDKNIRQYYSVEPHRIKTAIDIIKKVLEEVDSFYEEEKEFFGDEEKKQLDFKYKDIFINCPIVKFFCGEKKTVDTVQEYLRMIYLDNQIFQTANSGEGKETQD